MISRTATVCSCLLMACAMRANGRAERSLAGMCIIFIFFKKIHPNSHLYAHPPVTAIYTVCTCMKIDLSFFFLSFFSSILTLLFISLDSKCYIQTAAHTKVHLAPADITAMAFAYTKTEADMKVLT